jgi:hypothetical protein
MRGYHLKESPAMQPNPDISNPVRNATGHSNKGSTTPALGKIVSERDAENVTTIWVMACRDENAILTYKGISKRTSLPPDEVKNVVKRWRELFRLGAQATDLAIWKAELEKQRGRIQPVNYPEWLEEIPASEQEEAIKKLCDEDVFRSQFRLRKDDSKSDVPIIDFGCKYIQTHRQTDLEIKKENRENTKHEQQTQLDVERNEREQKIYRNSLRGLMATNLIAILALFTTSSLNLYSTWETSRQKSYEYSQQQIEYRNVGDAAFVKALTTTYSGVLTHDKDKCIASSGELDSTFLTLRPQVQQSLADGYGNLRSMCFDVIGSVPIKDDKRLAAEKFIQQAMDKIRNVEK